MTVRRLAIFLAGLAAVSVAGTVWARQTPVPPVAQPAPQPAPVTPPPAKVAPENEEPPPSLPAPPAPKVEPPAPTVEKPAEAEKPKAAAVEKPTEPMRRVRTGSAIIQALDKVTAETLRFEAPVGQPIRYKSIIVTVRACETSAPDEESSDAMAYLTVDSQPRSMNGRPAPAPKQIFRGWMFASSPGINPLEHPVYDAWLIACKASAPAPAKR